MTTASLTKLINRRHQDRRSAAFIERKLKLEVCKALQGGKPLKRTRSKRLRAMIAGAIAS